MTAWDTCSVCNKPTTSGMVVCYSCASKIIEEKRRAGIPIRRIIIDGETHKVPADSLSVEGLPRAPSKEGEHCPACNRFARRDSLGNFYCRNCGFKDGET